jgi:hypothetical protein
VLRQLKRLVIKELRINYILVNPETREKIELACSELGWSKASIIKQMLHGFMRRDGRFYAEAGIKDAAARGMSEEDYFKTLRDGKIEELSRYIAGKPGFGKTPIDDIPIIETTSETKYRYNLVGLSAYNYVLVRVAQIVDTEPLVQVISRMIVKHLSDNWEASYQPQIERDKQCKFL